MKIKDFILDKSNVTFIAAMNPTSNEEGRAPLPSLLQNLLIEIYFDKLTEKELEKIVKHKFCKNDEIFCSYVEKVLTVHR